MNGPTARVQRALADLSAGRPVVLTGDLIDSDSYLLIPAEKSTTSSIAFLVRYGSGLVCAALSSNECDRLGLVAMVGADRARTGTEYNVSVDAVGPGTGISAKDRAATLRSLADTACTSQSFTRPGHVLAARSAPRGIFDFRGPAEAAVDLMSVAGLHHACAYSALVSELDPTSVADSTEADTFARVHGLGLVSIEDIAIYRRTTEHHMLTEFTHALDTEHGRIRCVGYRSDVTESEYLTYSTDSPVGRKAPLVHFTREDEPASHLSGPGIADDALAHVLAHGHGTVVVAKRPPIDALPVDVHSDIAEVVRECGYLSASLHDFSPESRTMMWHLGLSITTDDAPVLADLRAPAPFGFERPTIAGPVVHGDQRGRELGFRTANLEIDEFDSVADGVWAGRCTLPDGSVVIAAISIGRRPTFYGRSGIRLLEAHLLDFSGDLYGAVLHVRLDHWMRGQVTFASKEELVAALAADVALTRTLVTV